MSYSFFVFMNRPVRFVHIALYTPIIGGGFGESQSSFFMKHIHFSLSMCFFHIQYLFFMVFSNPLPSYFAFFSLFLAFFCYIFHIGILKKGTGMLICLFLLFLPFVLTIAAFPSGHRIFLPGRRNHSRNITAFFFSSFLPSFLCPSL